MSNIAEGFENSSLITHHSGEVEPMVLAEVKREVERSKKRLEELRVSL
jgi:hypothetical protein